MSQELQKTDCTIIELMTRQDIVECTDDLLYYVNDELAASQHKHIPHGNSKKWDLTNQQRNRAEAVRDIVLEWVRINHSPQVRNDLRKLTSDVPPTFEQGCQDDTCHVGNWFNKVFYPETRARELGLWED